MNRDQRFEELLTLHLDDTMSAAELEEFERLVAEVPELRERAEEEALLVEVMRSARHQPVPSAALNEARQKARTAVGGGGREAGGKPNGIIGVRWWTMAAAAAFLAVIVWMTGGIEPTRLRTDDVALVPEIQAPRDGLFQSGTPSSIPAEAASTAEQPALTRGVRVREEGLAFGRMAVDVPDTSVVDDQIVLFFDSPTPLSSEIALSEQHRTERRPAPESRTEDAGALAAAPGRGALAMADAGEFSAALLPTRDQVLPIVNAQRGRVVVDTAYKLSAENFLNASPEIADERPSPDTRFMVVDFDDHTDATIVLADLARVTGTAVPPHEQSMNVDNRLMFNYQQSFLADRVHAFQIDVSERDAGVLRNLMSMSTEDEQEAEDSLHAPRQVHAEVATLDEFIDWVETQRGSLLFYTPDRKLAFERRQELRRESTLATAPETKAGTERHPDAELPEVLITDRLAIRSREVQADVPTPSPVPTLRPGFSGYLAFHFEDAHDVERFLDSLPHLTGEGLENLDLALVEILAQPTGSRVIIPYRMTHPTRD